MPSNLSFVKHRVQLHLKGSVGEINGSDVVVYWNESSGGQLDPVTSAMVGGTVTPLSGVLRAFGYEEPARTALRQFSEIQAGDLILEVDPNGTVELFPDQPVSGVTTLDSIATKGIRFEWCGKQYVQAAIGEQLSQSWNVTVQNQSIYRSLLVRLAT